MAEETPIIEKPKKKKKTPGQIRAARQRGAAKARAIARKKSLITRRANAKLRAKEKAKEERLRKRLKKKESERKARERYKRKLKREKEKRAIARKERERIQRHEKAIAHRNKKRRERYRRKKNDQLQSLRMKGKPGRNRRHYYIYYSHNNQIHKKAGLIGKYTTAARAAEALALLKKKNEEVIFERRNNAYVDVDKCTDEYVVLRRKFPDEPDVFGNVSLKNEYGKLVEHRVEGMDDMFFVNKIPARVEETIYVYGYDYKKDRKTFQWICENIIMSGFENGYDMKRIYLYHNKVVVRDDNDNVEIILLKCVDDALRFYNLLIKYCGKKHLLYMGNITTDNAMCPKLEELLKAKTGWDTHKLRRNKNRF